MTTKGTGSGKRYFYSLKEFCLRFHHHPYDIGQALNEGVIKRNEEGMFPAKADTVLRKWYETRKEVSA